MGSSRGDLLLASSKYSSSTAIPIKPASERIVGISSKHSYIHSRGSTTTLGSSRGDLLRASSKSVSTTAIPTTRTAILFAEKRRNRIILEEQEQDQSESNNTNTDDGDDHSKSKLMSKSKSSSSLTNSRRTKTKMASARSLFGNLAKAAAGGGGGHQENSGKISSDDGNNNINNNNADADANANVLNNTPTTKSKKSSKSKRTLLGWAKKKIKKKKHKEDARGALLVSSSEEDDEVVVEQETTTTATTNNINNNNNNNKKKNQQPPEHLVAVSESAEGQVVEEEQVTATTRTAVEDEDDDENNDNAEQRDDDNDQKKQKQQNINEQSSQKPLFENNPYQFQERFASFDDDDDKEEVTCTTIDHDGDDMDIDEIENENERMLEEGLIEEVKNISDNVKSKSQLQQQQNDVKEKEEEEADDSKDSNKVVEINNNKMGNIMGINSISRVSSNGNISRSSSGNFDRSVKSSGSGLYSTGSMNDSQEFPPVAQIKTIGGGDGNPVDEETLSDIGDTDVMNLEPEIIDGVEIIYNPHDDDIVYGDRGHPGTINLITILREILEENSYDMDYNPKVYKVIKKRLKGTRKFLVRARQYERTSWKEATKPENIHFLGDCFDEEKRRRREGITGNNYDDDDDNDDSEIDDSLQGSSAKEQSESLLCEDDDEDAASPSMSSTNARDISGVVAAAPAVLPMTASSAEKVRSEVALDYAFTPLSRKLTPRHANLQSSNKKPNYGYSHSSDDKTVDPIQRAIIECRSAQDFARPFGNKHAMNRGIAAEEKLLALIGMVDGGPSKTTPLKEELVKLEELANRMKYISIAPLFERLEEIEHNLTNYFEQKKTKDRENDGDADFQVDTEEKLYDEIIKEYDDGLGTKVEDGHYLEIYDSNEEMSSVGESGIFSNSSDVEDNTDKEAVEWIDVNGDDECNQTHRSNNSSDDDMTNVSSVEPIRVKTIFEKPNAKLEQFFDRLHHFFETRRKIEERAETVDPSMKCLKIKAKAHSGGILKKIGSYKREYQQRDPSDCLVQNLDDLYDAAQPAQTEFESFLFQIVDAVSGLDERSLILPPLKPRYRAYEKAKTEYSRRSPSPPESWLYDIVRAGIVCKTAKQLSDVNKWLGKNAHLVQAKNRFLEPVFNGYRDLLFHVSIPYRDGMAHVCEIQVHHKDIYVLNDQFGMIKHYDFFRSCFANPWRSQEDTLEDLSMMNKHSNIGGPLMKKLLKSNDPEQLRLFAGLFREKLDEFDRSLELYRRVLNLQEDKHGSEHEEMAATYLSIGLVLGAMGDTDASLLNLLKALAIQESFIGMDNVEVADSYVEIGHMLAKRGDYSGAYTQYERTLIIRENKLGKGHFLVIKSLQDIGLVLQKKGDLKESEIKYRRALSIQEEVLGDGHPDLATTHGMIGKTLSLYGDFTKALSENRLALSIREEGLGKNHPTAAESHTAIGVLLFRKGDYKASRWHHNKALRIRESMLGKDDEECSISHRYLGELLSCDGNYEGAVSELKRAQEILEATVGMDNPVTAGSYLDLGHIYCRIGKYDEGLAQYRRAKVIRESILGQNHPDTALTYMCVGNALNLEGNHEAALTVHRKALVVFESVLGNKHPRTAATYQSIADALLANGDTVNSLYEHRKALKIRKAVLLKGHPDTAESCSRIGNLLLNCNNDLKGALLVYRQALDITVGRCGKNHPESAMACVDVARVLKALGEANVDGALDEAETNLRGALVVLRGMNSVVGSDIVDSSFDFLSDEAVTGRACILLGTVLEMKGGFEEEAHDLCIEGLERLKTVLGEDHPETQAAELNSFLSVSHDGVQHEHKTLPNDEIKV